MMQWRRCKGFLFDIDGTLANTDPLHLVAIRDTFASFGASPEVVVDHDFIRENISGVDNKDIADVFLPHLSEEEKNKWIVEKEAYFRQVAKAQIEPVAGLRELMEFIKANGLKCAAVTNAPRENAALLLEGIGLRDHFDLVVIGCDPNQCPRAKPHPDPYLVAMKRLGLSPEECVAIEDSITGATAAVASGVHTIGILTSQTADAMAEIGVKQTIVDYHELLREIKASSLEQ